jgi:hypothetical protein
MAASHNSHPTHSVVAVMTTATAKPVFSLPQWVFALWRIFCERLMQAIHIHEETQRKEREATQEKEREAAEAAEAAAALMAQKDESSTINKDANLKQAEAHAMPDTEGLHENRKFEEVRSLSGSANTSKNSASTDTSEGK